MKKSIFPIEKPPCQFVQAVLSGFSQVAFQRHPLSGLILLGAAFLGSPTQALSALLATIAATAVSYLLDIPKAQIQEGLYGFNATLAGLAIPPLLFSGQTFSLQIALLALLAGILCVFLTSASGAFFQKWDVPALATPYCLTLLLFLTASLATNRFGATALSQTLAETTTSYTLMEWITACLNGISQVIWMNKPICGILYLIAILPFSRLDVRNSLIGVCLSTLTAVFLGLPKSGVLDGIYGFNAVLLMSVMTRAFAPSIKSYVLALFGAALTPVLCVATTACLQLFHISTFLAIPYVLICLTVFFGRNNYPGIQYIPARDWDVPEQLRKRFRKETTTL